MSAVTDALLIAVDETCDDFLAIAETVADPEELAQNTEAERRARAQFVHAFAELLREGLRGGREQRDLVMQTAVPALVANGRTSIDMVRGHIAFWMALSPRLLAAVPEDLRDDAGLWLARYAADFSRETIAIAREAERG